MNQKFQTSQTAVNLAIKFPREHAALLRSPAIYLPASSEVVTTLADEITDEITLLVSMTQAAVLTEIMGCGPKDESIGNKG